MCNSYFCIYILSYYIYTTFITMPKKCLPNTFCFEAYTFYLILFIILSIVFGLVYLLHNKTNTQPNNNRKTYNENINIQESNIFDTSKILNNKDVGVFYTNPNYVMSNDDSIYLNPYMPPLKSNPFYDTLFTQKMYSNRNNVRLAPINIPTSHYDFEFKQVGILTRTNGPEMILPIFGRPIHSNRNKWQYYTMTNNNNAIKLPISRKGKSCTGDYGCDELFNGDTVYVEGYKDSFNATIYENNTPRYIPF